MPKTFDANETARKLLNPEAKINREEKTAGLADLIENHLRELSTDFRDRVIVEWYTFRSDHGFDKGIFELLFYCCALETVKIGLKAKPDPIDDEYLYRRLHQIIEHPDFRSCSKEFKTWIIKEAYYVQQFMLEPNQEEYYLQKSDLLRFADDLTEGKNKIADMWHDGVTD